MPHLTAHKGDRRQAIGERCVSEMAMREKPFKGKPPVLAAFSLGCTSPPTHTSGNPGVSETARRQDNVCDVPRQNCPIRLKPLNAKDVRRLPL